MPSSFSDKFAQWLVEKEIEEIEKQEHVLGVYHDKQKDFDITWELLTAFELSDDSFYPTDIIAEKVPHKHEPGFEKPVAIIGAGVTGLRIAMMLKYLEIPYTIFEASKRYGGRVFTYHFPKKDGEKPSTQSYFDVGAMRFPDNEINKATFELFKELDITKEGGEGGKLLPYNLSTDDNILLYNGIGKTVSEIKSNPGQDHFNDGISNKGIVPDEYIKKKYVKPNGQIVYGVDACIAAAYEPYKFLIAKDPKLGWELLMHQDSRSTRAYLLDVMRYPSVVVDWIETRTSMTGGFSSAFTESIVSSLEFDYPTGYDPKCSKCEPEAVKWWCIDGGTEVLTKAMYESLGDVPNLLKSTRVASISKANKGDKNDKISMELTIEDNVTPIEFSHVVSTVPLACLRTIDLDGCNLDYAQKKALRSLKYGVGVKVAIRFKERWWQKSSYKLQGGLSKTDRQCRIVVYPNYSVNEDPDTPGVLMASYNLEQDASRFGSLIQSKDWSDPPAAEGQTPPSEKLLIDQLLADLAKIHGETPEWYKARMLDYYAFDWYHNPHSMGAFAHFGPGQFSEIYPSVTKPASDGLLHFGGEATSSHHGWIAGALVSAWRCVWEILAKDGSEKQKLLFKAKFSDQMEVDGLKTAAMQYYRGIFANSLEKPEGNKGNFPVCF